MAWQACYFLCTTYPRLHCFATEGNHHCLVSCYMLRALNVTLQVCTNTVRMCRPSNLLKAPDIADCRFTIHNVLFWASNIQKLDVGIAWQGGMCCLPASVTCVADKYKADRLPTSMATGSATVCTFANNLRCKCSTKQKTLQQPLLSRLTLGQAFAYLRFNRGPSWAPVTRMF